MRAQHLKAVGAQAPDVSLFGVLADVVVRQPRPCARRRSTARTHAVLATARAPFRPGGKVELLEVAANGKEQVHEAHIVYDALAPSHLGLGLGLGVGVWGL